MPRFHNWLQHHRLAAFFVLAYVIAWSSWPVYALGMMPRMEFLPIGPLAAAVIVIGLAEGRAGYKAWGRRFIRWRVGWAWYAVAVCSATTPACRPTEYRSGWPWPHWGGRSPAAGGAAKHS